MNFRNCLQYTLANILNKIGGRTMAKRANSINPLIKFANIKKENSPCKKSCTLFGA